MPDIQPVPLSTLKINPRNARTHSKKQIRQIADGFEAGKPGQPIESRIVTTRLIAKLFRLGGKGYRLIVQRNDSSRAQNRLA